MVSAHGLDVFGRRGVGRIRNRADKVILRLSVESAGRLAVSIGSIDSTLVVHRHLWSFIPIDLVFAVNAFSRGRDVEATGLALHMGWRDGPAFPGAGGGF